MNNKKLLGWFIETIFVLALIFFSGHISPSPSSKAEPTRIELQKQRWTNLTRTISLEEACFGCPCTSPTKGFTAHLLQYAREIAVRIKSNARDLPARKLQVHSIVTYYSNDPSDAEKG